MSNSSNLHPSPSHFLWLDLEMTGLESQFDLIVELAAVITDANLNILTQYEQGVLQPLDDLKKRWAKNEWWQQQSAAYQKGILKTTQTGQALDKIEKDILALIKKYIPDQSVVIAGNSIHTDRLFIQHYLPNLEAKLHYRMLDVSAFKVFMQAAFDWQFVKETKHRALDDIFDSIKELKFYLKKLKK